MANHPQQHTSYQLYRQTTLGQTLVDALDDLVQYGQITPQLAGRVVSEFDKAINSALASRVKNRVSFKGHLNTYRYCDNVWTLLMTNCEFRESHETQKADKLKIVACESLHAHKTGAAASQQTQAASSSQAQNASASNSAPPAESASSSRNASAPPAGGAQRNRNAAQQQANTYTTL